MVELVVVGALAFCAFIVVGTLVAAASLLGWLISLPFRLFGLALRGLGLVVGLPFLIVGAILGVVFFGATPRAASSRPSRAPLRSARCRPGLRVGAALHSTRTGPPDSTAFRGLGSAGPDIIAPP